MSSEFADLLAESHAAVRLRTSRLGMTRAMDKAQSERVADLFYADKKMVGGKSKLFASNKAWSAINKVLKQAKDHWEANTLPFPEDGVRLLKRDKLTEFNTSMMRFTAALDQAVAGANAVYSELLEDAREKRGSLFDSSQYPTDLSSEYSLNWEVVNVSPPDYLKETMPILYRREQERIAAQMQASVTLAENAFQAEFGKVVSHLAEQLQGVVDGKPKRFHPSQLSNVVDFINRFRDLSIGSDEEMERLVTQAESVCNGVDVSMLEDNSGIQTVVAQAMGNIGEQLDRLVELRPTRAIRWDDD